MRNGNLIAAAEKKEVNPKRTVLLCFCILLQNYKNRTERISWSLLVTFRQLCLLALSANT